MKPKFCLGLLFLILIASIYFALISGSAKLSPKEIVSALTHPEISSQAAAIIWKLRIPRIILGLLVGAGLACCGTVFQAILRNGLAEPYTLGISSGAALGATFGIVLNLSSAYTVFFSFLGSLATIFLVYAIAARKRFSNPTLILSGVTLGLLFSSLVLLIFSLAKPEAAHSAIIWLMGILSYTQGGLLKLVAIFIIIGVSVLIILGRDIDIICLGEEKAKHLGLEVSSLKKLLFLISSLITAGCVSSCGIIGFVGLIIPHICRLLMGINHRRLLPAAVLLGAAFLVFCDTLARTIISPLELPVGVITGIFGGIFFLSLLLRAKNWELS